MDKRTSLRQPLVHGSVPRSSQRGVVLIIALIALTILLIGGVALVRSFDTSMLLSGNLALKRDLVNQGERGMADAIALFKAGTLTDTSADKLDMNYSASVLPSDAKTGIPLVLTGEAATPAMTAAERKDHNDTTSIRYVVDRQCAGSGEFNADTCMYTETVRDRGGSNHLKKAGGGFRPVYRISVRVNGARNTQAYLQSTFTF